MDDRLRDYVIDFNDDIDYYNSQEDKQTFYNRVRETIIAKTKEYYMDGADKKDIADDLSRLYNMLYYIQSTIDIGRTYLLDEELEKLPPTYVIDEKPVRFEVNEDILNNIDVSQGLSIEEANELLKWTSNNTRDNMIKEGENYIHPTDVYGNDSLCGLCGFSQYSSLYPLEKMGLHVTINNMSLLGLPSHAFGSVVIPIRENGEIVNKRYLIDVTYRQFFQVKENIISRYINGAPLPGFFVNLDEDNIEFSKGLMQTGFVEATEENLKKYYVPFMMEGYSLDKSNVIKDMIPNIRFEDILENKQREFDYDEEEFIELGFNLSINGNMTK